MTQRKQLNFIGTYNRFADKQGIYNFPALDSVGTYIGFARKQGI
jgi:hypothetical protein